MTLTCPECGNTEEFRYCEDQTVCLSYEIIKIAGGALEIDPDAVHSPLGGAGDGTDPFIECGECGESFPVPTDLKLSILRRRRQ